MEETAKKKVLKNGRSKTVGCNGSLLCDILESKGFKPYDVAKMLGYHPSYFTKVRNRNEIGVTCIRLLEERLGIHPEQYNAVGVEWIRPSDINSGSDSKSTSAVRRMIERKKAESAASRTSSDLLTVSVNVDLDQLKKLIKEAVAEAFNDL